MDSFISLDNKKVEALMLKITNLLKEETIGKMSHFSFAMFLSQHLTAEEFEYLATISDHMGENGLNLLIIAAMVKSGKFKSEDGVSVSAV